MSDEASDLHGSDEQRDEHRQAGDGEVVIDLANRLGEGPVVSKVHETSVEGVEKAHPGGEEDRKREHRVEGQSSDDRRSGQDQQGHLGRGVEAQSEEHADRVHLPGCVDPLGIATEEPAHESPVVELALQFGVVVPALAHLAAHLDDRPEHHQVEQTDEPQEGAGDRRPDETAPVVQRAAVILDGAIERRMPKFNRTASKKTMVE